MLDRIVEFVLEQLKTNDLFAGGAILASMAFILNYLRRVPSKILYWARLLFVTQIDIPDRAESFKWVSDWLSQHPYTQKSKRITIEVGGFNNDQVVMTPAPGRHLIWWRFRPVIITRIRNEGTGDNAHRAFRESWNITMFGQRKMVNKFIEECRKSSRSDKDKFIKIRTSDGNYWGNLTRKHKRSFESVILPCGLQERLMADVHEFISSKDWYYKMGIPWRRGYLLAGPPGNGKSSVVTAVASEIDFEVCIINLGQTEEDELSGLMSDLKEKSILLLEDIDCAFIERENRKPISMSTLLNLLDGVNAPEGRLVFITTNHPEKLDSALIRPGRVDLQVILPDATEKQIERLYERFHPNYEDATQFAKLAMQYKPTMANLQGYFLQYRNSSQKTMDNIKELAYVNIPNLESRLQENQLAPSAFDVC